MEKVVRIAITGAAGQIGYALLFRIASGALFGPNTPIQLHLIERPEAKAALAGVAMELQDCAFPCLHKVICTDELSVGFDQVDWALLIGAAPRSKGMERADLLAKNAAIFAEQGKALDQHASRDVRVVVVGNPCNTNALIAMSNAPSLPRTHFFAMTMLDQNRAVGQLAAKANTSVEAIQQCFIWGNHSATQFPDFYHANIEGQACLSVIEDETWLQDTFLPTVQKRGAEVIQARGASSAASAASALIDTVKNLNGALGQQAFSVACYSEGQYGAQPGLIVSYPCYINEAGECCVLTDIEHNEYAREKISLSMQELQQEYETVKTLGLI